jgi:prephenate dehydratase
MAYTVRTVEYFATSVPDKAGAGHGIIAALAAEGVNLLAMSGFPTGAGKAQLDLIPEDAAAFAKAASRLKLRTRKPKRAFLLQGEDRVGAVAEALGRLAAQKIHVIAAQALSAGSGRWAMILWVRPASYQKAAKALGA